MYFLINLEQLTDVKYAVHSPRFNHAKDKLVSTDWLSLTNCTKGSYFP